MDYLIKRLLLICLFIGIWSEVIAQEVVVDEECISTYLDLELEQKYSYIIYKLSEDLKTIVVDYPLGKLGETYDAFRKRLIDAGDNSQGRYAVIDCKYVQDKAGKVVFITWLSENVDLKQKVLYASSKDSLKRTLRGIGIEIECNDTDDLAFSAIVKHVKDKYD